MLTCANLKLAAVIEEKIRGLEIAVYHPMPVHELYSRQQLHI
jgi:hypothetical protein